MYEYLVYIHRDGKILDQWRRINGSFEDFFIPLDLEVTNEEMMFVIHQAGVVLLLMMMMMMICMMVLI